MSMPSVSFPFLTNLSIFAPSSAVDTYLCSHWDVPQLTRLSILTSTPTERSPIHLLERLGSRLRYLHLYPMHYTMTWLVPIPDVSTYIPTLTSTLSALCPLLEHLIVPCHARLLVVNSPTLEHLDVWLNPPQTRPAQIPGPGLPPHDGPPGKQGSLPPHRALHCYARDPLQVRHV